MRKRAELGVAVRAETRRRAREVRQVARAAWVVSNPVKEALAEVAAVFKMPRPKQA